jgi:hypothetical protein
VEREGGGRGRRGERGRGREGGEGEGRGRIGINVEKKRDRYSTMVGCPNQFRIFSFSKAVLILLLDGERDIF